MEVERNILLYSSYSKKGARLFLWNIKSITVEEGAVTKSPGTQKIEVF